MKLGLIPARKIQSWKSMLSKDVDAGCSRARRWSGAAARCRVRGAGLAGAGGLDPPAPGAGGGGHPPLRLVALETPQLLELGCALLRTPPGAALARAVFFGRGSFPDHPLAPQAGPR